MSELPRTMKQAFRKLLQNIGILGVVRRIRQALHVFLLYQRRRLRAPRMSHNGQILVNLGCGERSGPGYINVDIRPLANIHYVHDIRTLPMFADQSVDLLYACHVLEHIPRSELRSILCEWRRVLKSDGIFRFSVPDFDILLEVYRSAGNQVDSIVNQLMGQGPPYDNHYSIWNEAYARTLLGEVGFTNIRTWDPATARYHDFSDKSARIMPIGDRSVLISLNLEAEAR